MCVEEFPIVKRYCSSPLILCPFYVEFLLLGRFLWIFYKMVVWLICYSSSSSSFPFFLNLKISC